MGEQKFHNHKSYQNESPLLIRLMSNPEKVLDLGCNQGTVSRHIIRTFPNVKVWGIEINPEALKLALPVLEDGWAFDLDDLDTLENKLSGLYFDHIIAGDVLEHTWKIEEITGILYKHLAPRGKIIISVPNFGHWTTLLVFFSRKWRRNPRGIFDKTHKKVIMLRNLREFASQCPDGIFKIAKRNYRFADTLKWPKLNKLIILGLYPVRFIPYFRDFITFGYVITITKP